mmetsp:Transcript_37712/g.106560  ORF Transcript_37712/g.106560 Transcript_37712/m.106560 type:complete len:217 (+) Transcript_37712:92-742(+)
MGSNGSRCSAAREPGPSTKEAADGEPTDPAEEHSLGSGMLTADLLRLVVSKISPDWFPVILRVNKQLRDVVEGLPHKDWPLDRRNQLSVRPFAARLMLLQWAHSQGCPLSPNLPALVAEHGDLQALQWLHAQGCPWDSRTCAAAAKRGHVAVIEWAVFAGCKTDESICSSAASSGDLETLQWLRARGFSWDSWTCMKAAGAGDMICNPAAPPCHNN